MKTEELRAAFTKLMTEVATAVGKAKKIDEVAALVNLTRTGIKTLTDNEKAIKPKIAEVLLKNGVVKEAGQVTKHYSFGGWHLKGYQASGLDPNKVCAALVAKKVEPKKFMVETVKYSLPPDGSSQLATLKSQFTEAQLKDMEVEPTWTISTPEQED